MSDEPDIYVLDSSAWLALIEDEEGAETVEALLMSARSGEVVVLTSFMSFMEVYYITRQEREREEAEARMSLMAAAPTLRVESTESLGVVAAALKAEHRLSVADAWIAALAKERGATLVHKDPEFEQIGDEIAAVKLPYTVGT